MWWALIFQAAEVEAKQILKNNGGKAIQVDGNKYLGDNGEDES